LTEPAAMKFIDLNELEDGSSIEADLCIVGSGPAGVSIAKEFAGSKVQVLVLEGGRLELTPADQALYDFDNVGVVRRTPQELAYRNRVVGGSSHTWDGRCVSFDEIDFESRPWIPHSGWPIKLADIHPFLERSKKYLGLGPNIYDDRLWEELAIAPPHPGFDPALLKSQFWQDSRDSRTREVIRFARTIAEIDAPNIKMLTHANVTHINMGEDGARVDTLNVCSLDGRRAKAKANVIVLACGGLENARLLLVSNKLAQNGVGNSHDLVGRFLMDHAGCTLGWFDPPYCVPIQNRFGYYLLDHEGGRNNYFFGLMLSPEIQRKEQLLNCAAFVNQIPSTDDPWNALKRCVRPRDKTNWINRVRDAPTVIRGLPRLLNNVYRRVALRRGPILKTAELPLYCLVEQTPDPASRVTLSPKTDALGMPLLRIDWRIGDRERGSVLRLSDLIGSELHRAGLPEHVRNKHLLHDADWRSQFIDRAHPSGTTRMSASPKQGVVDRNCKVHEIDGLYIAGSSVFPTAGHANPTLMIVSLAIRLADWLKRREFAAGRA
jgi:choline dehydrogenase-like flavoprotein